MDRNYIIGMVLIAVVFIAWMFYVSQSTPPAPQMSEEEVFGDSVAMEEIPADTSIMTSETASQRDTVYAASDTLPAEFVTVSTDLYDAVLSTKGAGLTSFKLKTFTYLDEQDGPVEMIHSNAVSVPNFRFRDNPLRLEDRNFEVDRTSLTMTGKDTGTLQFTYTFPGGETITKKYKFHGDLYRFEIDFEVNGVNSLGLKDYYQFYFEPGLEPSEIDVNDDLSSFRANALMGSDIERFD